jgi:hypothetical protein
MEEITPDAAKLKAARDEVQGYLEKKNKWSKLSLVAAGAAEALFLVLTLVFMDFDDATHRFIFFGLMFVYCPVIILVFRNSIRIDQLYYRIVDELKYERTPK